METPHQPNFALFTRAAPPGLAQIHNRMPVILPAEQADGWLTGAAEIDECGIGDPDAAVEYFPVSTRLLATRAKPGPWMIEPIVVPDLFERL